MNTSFWEFATLIGCTQTIPCDIAICLITGIEIHFIDENCLHELGILTCLLPSYVNAKHICYFLVLIKSTPCFSQFFNGFQNCLLSLNPTLCQFSVSMKMAKIVGMQTSLLATKRHDCLLIALLCTKRLSWFTFFNHPIEHFIWQKSDKSRLQYRNVLDEFGSTSCAKKLSNSDRLQ